MLEADTMTLYVSLTVTNTILCVTDTLSSANIVTMIVIDTMQH